MIFKKKLKTFETVYYIVKCRNMTEMEIEAKRNLCALDSDAPDFNAILDETASKDIVSVVPRER